MEGRGVQGRGSSPSASTGDNGTETGIDRTDGRLIYLELNLRIFNQRSQVREGTLHT